MATEVPANEHLARDRHQLQTLILAITLLVTTLLAVIVAILAASGLDRYGVLHFPLGFYLLAQGLVIFIVVWRSGSFAFKSASIWRGANARGSVRR